MNAFYFTGKMIKKLYKLYLQHPIITTDSRICPKNSIFFALKGENFNGNVFALSALAKGCSYAIVDEKEFATDNRFILVDNTLDTLHKLAEHHRKQLTIPVIGITGTNGKTTTKELIAAVLSKKYNVLYTQENFNNHIGVPLTVLRITKKHDIAIIEMGANHPGEIKMLTEIARPNFGIITSIGKAHLEGFGSLEGVLATKGELYDFLRKSNGKIFRNENVECLKPISTGLEAITYGINIESASVCGKIISESPFVTLSWYEQQETEAQTVTTHFIGAYNASNMLAAVTVGRYFGVVSADIVSALHDYIPQNNRSQLVKTSKNTLIIDAYNANPTSMEAALNSFRNMEIPHKVVILGDMLELGLESAKEHQAIVEILKKNSFDDIFLVGKCFAEVSAGYKSFTDINQLSLFLEIHPLINKSILIKGSHGIGLQKIIDKL